MKRVVCLFMALCMMLPAFASCANADTVTFVDPGTYLGTMCVFNCDEWVSLRAQPDTQSERLAKVPLGAVVYNCYMQDDRFIYAEYEDLCGFILADYLSEEMPDIEPVYYGSMKVVRTPDWVEMYDYPGFESLVLQRIPLDAVVSDCREENEEYIWGCYNDQYGYISSHNLEIIEGPYADSDDILSNTRVRLNSVDAGFGVYLISTSMGGDWSILEEKHHLGNVLTGMPEEWQPLVSTIPDERIIEIIGGYELFLIIPADEQASVTVNRLELGYDGFTGNVAEELYYSDSGEPFLLRCSIYNYALDCEICIADTDGDEHYWYPNVLPTTGRVFDPQIEGQTYCVLNEYEEE